MVNEHVKDLQYISRESHLQGNIDTEDDFAYNGDDQMPISDWEMYYSEDLYNMWNAINVYGKTTGSFAYCMEYATYSDFVEFCYENSSKKIYHAKVGQ